jgi:hypothetical protein
MITGLYVVGRGDRHAVSRTARHAARPGPQYLISMSSRGSHPLVNPPPGPTFNKSSAKAQAGELRSTETSRKRLATWPILRLAFILLTIALVVFGFKLNGEAQAGVFFGSGAVMLALLLGEIRHRLRTAKRTASTNRPFTLPALSALNTARNPGRSTLTIGLVAAATFLIVAISAFRLDTGEGGTGGFALIATSDQPIHYDLNTAEGRLELGFADAASESSMIGGFTRYASGGRRRELSESLSADATTSARCARCTYRSRRLRLG